MAETRFIKTVVFGGYDKADVDKRFEFLYSQYYDMKNALREAKLMLNKYKEGSDAEAVHESVLANERAKLSEFQVKNETLTEKLKATDDDNKKKEAEIAALKEKLEQTEAELKDTKSKLQAASGSGDATMLTTVFTEAQKSANMIIETAQKQASEMDADSKKLAENMVADANNKAAKIIFDAETQSAKLIADAENMSNSMQVASGNMKATMLTDMENISSEIERLRTLLDEFGKTGTKILDDSSKLLDESKKELTAGGVPTFKEPVIREPKLPEAPVYAEIDNTYMTGIDENERKKNEELDKLKAMAESLSGSKAKAAEEPKKEAEPKKEEEPKKADAPAAGGLADILKKAKSIK